MIDKPKEVKYNKRGNVCVYVTGEGSQRAVFDIQRYVRDHVAPEEKVVISSMSSNYYCEEEIKKDKEPVRTGSGDKSKETKGKV